MRGAVHPFPFFPQLFFSLSIPASPVLPAFSLLLCLWARSLSRLCLKPSASFAFPSGFLVSLWSCRELSEAREGGPLQEQGRDWRVSGRAEQEGRFLNQGPSLLVSLASPRYVLLATWQKSPFPRSVIFPLLLLHYWQAPERLMKSFTAKGKSTSSHVLHKLILEIMEQPVHRAQHMQLCP